MGARWHWLGLLACAALSAACGDDDGPAGETDAAVEDMAPRDLGRDREVPDEDTGTPDDDMGTPDDDMGTDPDTGPIEPPDAGPMRDAGPLGDECTTAGETVVEACGTCGARELFCLATGRFAVGECTGSLDEPLGGDSVSHAFDTRFAPVGLLDMAGCVDIFDPTTMPRPPQVVVPYTVPGTGAREIVFTTQNDATDAMFDTQIQVRRDTCEAAPSVPTDVCFHGSAHPDGTFDLRAAGTVVAEGGDLLYFVVSAAPFSPFGGGGTGRGVGRLDITIRAPTAPTLSMARHIVLADSSTWFEVEGSDAGGDPSHILVTSLDAMGNVVDVNFDRVVDENDTVPAYPTFLVLPTPTTFRMTMMGFSPPELSAVVTRVRISAVDLAGNVSAPIETPVVAGEAVNLPWGATCSAARWCRFDGIRCGASGRCEHTTPALETACAAGTRMDLTAVAPRAGATTRITDGEGLVSSFCGDSGGRESFFHVGVPDGMWDVIGSTRVAATPAGQRTIVYATGSCASPDFLACDAGFAGDVRSETFVTTFAATTMTFVVEIPWTPTTDFPPTDIGFEARLRPVIPFGGACDPMGIENRCEAGVCMAGVCGF